MKQERDFNRLIQRAKAGNQQACTEIYESTSQAVYRTVHAMVRSEELARDIQQDTYVQAFTHLDQLGDPEKLLPWLRAIAVNQARTVLRKRQPILFSELSDEDDSPDPEPVDESVEASPELALDRKETSALVRELLGGLTDAQRMLVGMYYYEQIPIKQIAQDLGVSEGAVKTQLMRSRKKVEEGVHQLEQRGIKLFGLGPLPFLLQLLKREELGTETGRQVLSGALAKSAETAAPVALHVGRRFVETAAGKVLLCLLTVGAIGGGIAGYGWAKEKLNAPMGDYRPTDTSIVLLNNDSREDLPTVPVTTRQHETEPTIETTVDAPENLATEPSPSSAEQHAGSAEPYLPSSERQGNETRASEASSEPEPTPDSSAQYYEPKVLDWYWINYNLKSGSPEDLPAEPVTMDRYDLQPDSSLFLYVITQGEDTPRVYTDNPDMAVIQYRGRLDRNYNDEEGVWKHVFGVDVNGSGIARISCELNGVFYDSLKIENPEYPPKLIGVGWFLHHPDDQDTINDLLINNQDYVTIETQNSGRPNVYTDRPDILPVEYLDSGPGNYWYQSHTRWHVKVLGYGTAHLFIEINGELVKTYTLQADEFPKTVRSFRWIHCPDGQYGVGGTDWIEMYVEGSVLPNVYTDNPDAVRMRWQGFTSGETGGRITGYHIIVDMLAPCSGNIYCELEGNVLYTLPLTIIDPADP